MGVVMGRVVRCLVAATAATSLSCSSSSQSGGAADAGQDGFVILRDAGSDAPAPVEGGSGEGGPLVCPGTAGPTMVQAGTTCVDSTEVTRKQYAAFLATNPSISTQVDRCGWNQTFVPRSAWPSNDDVPVTYVNWCDAAAFCAWAGKRMCTKGEAATACAGTPPTSCNLPSATADAAAGGPGYVGSDTACTATSGAFDMIGNVQEWWSDCKPPAAGQGDQDVCDLGGGSFRTAGNCGTLFEGGRIGAFDDLGFRCCGP